jgi:hypothetical protein
MPSNTVPITRRARALALLEEGILVSRIIEHHRIKQIAIERGYDSCPSKQLPGRHQFQHVTSGSQLLSWSYWRRPKEDHPSRNKVALSLCTHLPTDRLRIGINLCASG